MTPFKPAHQIDYTKFLKFHPDANGASGRTVYIDPALIPRFLELIDLSSDAGVQVARGLVGLKNAAAGINSDTNNSNAFQHRTTVQNVVATYTVLQNGGRGAGVYITHLQHGFGRDADQPGLYKVEPRYQGDSRWTVTQDNSSTMPSLVGALGALAPTEDGKSNAIDTADAFASGALAKERIMGANGFSLFYTPTYVIDGMGVWLTSDQKQSCLSANCAKKFAQLLANTENKPWGPGASERYKWYIVGQGAKVFQQALQEYKRLSKHPLNRSHDFYFVDPQVPLGELQQELRNNGIDFYHDRNIISDSMSVASKALQFVDPAQTYINMHRPWKQDQAVNVSVKEATKAFEKRHSSQVYFSDIIKKMHTALSQRWC